MARPGTVVVLRETPSNISVPTDTGTAFMVGLTDRGPLQARLIYSLQEFITLFGARQTYSPFYDSVEHFFREGGNKTYIGRVVGPAPTSGFKNIPDAGAGVSLIATAIGPGAWSAGYKVAVVAGVGAGTFKIQVTDSANVVLEDSGDLLTQQAAIQWSQQSSYIRLTLGATTLNPAVAAASALSAGADDRLNVTDAQWLNALNLFSKDLGPGQVLAPGRTSVTGHTQLKDHAEANNRVALLDLQDTPTVATLQGDAVAVRSRFIATFAPWVVIPGVTSAAGSYRTVPPSAMIAGMIARNDPALGPNRPAAANAGVSRFAIDLSQPAWTDTVGGQREALNGSGVNVIRRKFGGIRNYGWRSTTDPITDRDWLDFGNARLFNAIASELDIAAENFLFAEIDGQDGETIGSFHTALAGVLLDHFNRNELFGDTADKAFSVDTGHSVNTLATIAANELHAVVALRMATMAEWIQIEIVKVNITTAV